MCVYNIYTNIKVMSKKSITLTVETDKSEIEIVYKKWTIYFTKKELSKLFWEEKSIIEKTLKNINAHKNVKYLKIKKDKIIKIYPLDTALIVWYKLKDFSTSKELIKINKIVKESHSEEFALERFKEKYNYIKNILLFKHMH